MNLSNRLRAVAIVPTLGRSSHLRACLDALRREGLPTVLVAPADTPLDASCEALATTVARSPRRLGFAAANHLGLAAEPAASAPWLALVNDDAVVAEGWLERLAIAIDGLDDADGVAAVQGAVLRMDPAEADRLDGAGLAWNRWGQAVQWGHGHPPSILPHGPFEVFGVSATAALYRRRALDQVAGDQVTGDQVTGDRLAKGSRPFDESLGSYYEDVDLAGRLRAAGWRALSVPSARAVHAGSVTGSTLGARRLVRRNRYLVLAHLLGRRLLAALPTLALRDAVDLVRALARGRAGAAAHIALGAGAGIVRGVMRALRTSRAGSAGLGDLARRWPDAEGPP